MSASDATTPPVADHRSWPLALIVVVGLAVRVALLPAPGFVGDIDQFVTWVGHIARNGLPNAYDAQLSFGPVMAYVWGLIGWLDPAVANAADSSDVGVRIVMKLPAITADLVLAATAWYALRSHPRWATVAVAVMLLHPVIPFTSAWWGQYDSVYAAAGAVAFVLAIRGRDALAVVALAVALMTKPQAAPFVIPFAAWYLARAGWRGQSGWTVAPAVGRLAVLAAIGLGTIVLLWLPFLAANGPVNYLAGLARYQNEFYAVLSISSWNLWWPIQEAAAPGVFVLDSSPMLGGLSFRVAGYAITAFLLALVGYGVARRPTPRTLAIGLAAAVLVAYTFLTTMHERYAFAAVTMLAFVVDDRRMRRLSVIFGVTIFANTIAATGHYIGELVPFRGEVSFLGSIVTVGCALFLVLELVRNQRRAEPASVINEAVPEPVAATPPSTSAGSAEATSGA